MARRELVQLGKAIDLDKIKVAGASVSEKLDGLRCIWDGGITEGLSVSDVPWANFERDKKDKLSTGLWTRLGKPINAHPDWLATLPRNLMLDGELYLGTEALEDTMAVKRDAPDPNFWSGVTYQVFDTPSRAFFQDGEIVYDASTRKEVNFINFNPVNCVGQMFTFERRQEWLRAQWGDISAPDHLILVDQHVLPADESSAREKLYTLFDATVDRNGEGLMVRLAGLDYWVPHRVGSLLKFKPEHESSGTVTGYYAAEYGKKGTLVGMMGSLEVLWNGHTFTLSGFKQSERILNGRIGDSTASNWAVANAGKRLPDSYSSALFPLLTEVEFKYTSLTQAGVPREARFHRTFE